MRNCVAPSNRSFKFLAAFPRTVIRWCLGSFDLLKVNEIPVFNFVQLQNIRRLKLAQRSVEGRNFHCTGSVRRCVREPEEQLYARKIETGAILDYVTTEPTQSGHILVDLGVLVSSQNQNGSGELDPLRTFLC